MNWIDKKWLGWKGAVLLVGLGAAGFAITKLIQYVFSQGF